MIWRFSFVKTSHNQRSRVLWEWVPSINANLGTLTLIILAWWRHVKCMSGTFSFWYAFPPSLVVTCQVMTWSYDMTSRNSRVLFWYVLPPRLVIIAFVILALWLFKFVTRSRNQKSSYRYFGHYFIVPSKSSSHTVSFLKLWQII